MITDRDIQTMIEAMKDKISYNKLNWGLKYILFRGYARIIQLCFSSKNINK
jgi:hypothetical protein